MHFTWNSTSSCIPSRYHRWSLLYILTHIENEVPNFGPISSDIISLISLTLSKKTTHVIHFPTYARRHFAFKGKLHWIAKINSLAAALIFSSQLQPTYIEKAIRICWMLCRYVCCFLIPQLSSSEWLSISLMISEITGPKFLGISPCEAGFRKSQYTCMLYIKKHT